DYRPGHDPIVIDDDIGIHRECQEGEGEVKPRGMPSFYPGIACRIEHEDEGHGDTNMDRALHQRHVGAEITSVELEKREPTAQRHHGPLKYGSFRPLKPMRAGGLRI